MCNAVILPSHWSYTVQPVSPCLTLNHRHDDRSCYLNVKHKETKLDQNWTITMSMYHNCFTIPAIYSKSSSLTESVLSAEWTVCSGHNMCFYSQKYTPPIQIKLCVNYESIPPINIPFLISFVCWDHSLVSDGFWCHVVMRPACLLKPVWQQPSTAH